MRLLGRRRGGGGGDVRRRAPLAARRGLSVGWDQARALLAGARRDPVSNCRAPRRRPIAHEGAGGTSGPSTKRTRGGCIFSAAARFTNTCRTCERLPRVRDVFA